MIMEGMPVSVLEGISCDKKQLILEPETYGVIPIYPKPLTANYKNVSWDASNSTHITVDENGVIYAVSQGESEITATISDNNNNSYKAKCSVIVGEPTGILSVVADSEIKIWTENHFLLIEGLRVGQQCCVYSLDGVMEYQGSADKSLMVIPIKKEGVYIVKVDKLSKKVIAK